jgi:hypothetical protein
MAGRTAKRGYAGGREADDSQLPEVLVTKPRVFGLLTRPHESNTAAERWQHTVCRRVYPSESHMHFSRAWSWSIQTTALQSVRDYSRRARSKQSLVAEICFMHCERQPDAAF